MGIGWDHDENPYMIRDISGCPAEKWLHVIRSEKEEKYVRRMCAKMGALLHDKMPIWYGHVRLSSLVSENDRKTDLRII